MCVCVCVCVCMCVSMCVCDRGERLSLNANVAEIVGPTTDVTKHMCDQWGLCR